MKKLIWAAAFLATAGFLGFALLPPAGTVPVLMYHFVDSAERAAKENIVVSEQSFSSQMAFLKFFRYRVISLDELFEIKAGLRSPEARSVAITFDDGNTTFAEKAVPILKKFGFPVAMFVVSDNVKGGLHGSMSESRLRELAGLDWVTFGSHSKTHPLLSKMEDAQVAEEAEASKKYLEELLGRPVYYFAYPSGDHDERTAEIVKQAGYRMAFATSRRRIPGWRENLFALPRVKITRRCDPLFFFWLRVSGLASFFKDYYEKFRLNTGFSSPSQKADAYGKP